MTTSSTAATGAPLPIYLGPALPRWQPRTLADVQTAVADGTLAERHWLDVKELVGTGDGAKKELARDLASFANDGGGLIIGVAEDKTTGVLSLAPVELAGLPERIDQVARTRCDPPLYVACHPLPNGVDPSRGVLLVEIPASPSAPHMVEGAYHGRGDTTKHKLTDAEVANMHARRTARQLTGEQVIAREIERSPVRPADQQSTHLYVVAQPLASPPDLLTPLVDRPQQLREIIRAVDLGLRGSSGFDPNLDYATKSEPRPRGAGFCSGSIVGRRFQPQDQSAAERSQIDLEVGDDGSIVLFFGGASRQRDDTGPHFVHGHAVVGLTRIVVGLAGRLGSDNGYAGRWLLAAGLTNLRDRYSHLAANNLSPLTLPPYSEDAYVQATEAVTAELLAQPGAVTSRLLHRLLRALGDPSTSYGQCLVDVV